MGLGISGTRSLLDICPGIQLDSVGKRAVHILLVCFLLNSDFCLGNVPGGLVIPKHQRTSFAGCEICFIAVTQALFSCRIEFGE